MPQPGEDLGAEANYGFPQRRSSESVPSGFNRSAKIAAVIAFELILGRLDMISDPRRAQGKRFEQRYVLLFAVLAIVTGADSYRGIHTFIKVHLKRLDKAFALGWKKPPAHTSIRSILSGLNAADAAAAFRSHAADLGAALKPGEAQCRVVAIDGKVLRESFDAFHDGAARQILSAFAAGTALTIAHIEIDVKSNEIPAAQQLLAELDLGGRIVTLDAIHCQKTFAIAKARGVDLIVQLKGTRSPCAGRLRQVEAGCHAAAPTTTCQTVDRHKRNRHETRTTTVFDARAIISDLEWRKTVAAIIRIERIVQTFQTATGMWMRSGEISYYLSNRPIEAEHAGDAIRRHWDIENRSHHVRDVTLGEDASRIRINPGVFARLRSSAANILRFNQVASVRQDRYAAALAGFDALAKLRFH